jgi:type IV pilus assembly protein PilA
MTASMLRPQLQATVLRKPNATSSHKKNLLQKGFTLVELMIVIVIVGILSAVALPNFLNQTNKAKGTEAKTKLTALLKETHAEYQVTGNVNATQTAIANSVTTANSAGKFDYAVTVADPVVTGTATGDGTADANLTGVVYNGCVNVDTGAVEIGSNPGDAVTCV